MKTELWLPLDNAQITQSFGGNANDSYKNANLIGHTGIDFVSYYGDKIRAAQTGNIYKQINFNTSDLTKFRAVFQIIDMHQDETFELCYGHCIASLRANGATTVGDFIATEGNTGEVYVNGRPVTEAERLSGSKAGTHLHFQVRAVTKTKTFVSDRAYLTDINGGPYQDAEGNYFWIHNYNNGFNGCIDPMLLLNNKPAKLANETLSLIAKLKAFLAQFSKSR